MIWYCTEVLLSTLNCLVGVTSLCKKLIRNWVTGVTFIHKNNMAAGCYVFGELFCIYRDIDYLIGLRC